MFKIQKTIERNNSKTYVYSALKVIRIPRSASDVYEVRNASTDEKSVTEYFQKYVDQIINEIEIMSELKGHPNIVSYEDHSVIPHRGGSWMGHFAKDGTFDTLSGVADESYAG